LQLAQYRNHLRILAIAWCVFGGLSLLLGFAGLSFFSHMYWIHELGLRTYGHMSPWTLPMVFHFAWMAVTIRAALAFLTGWALLQRARWSRILVIILAILSLFRFPFGTALGIWTLIKLLGYRNTALYEQL
jgi:hypothetical protein